MAAMAMTAKVTIVGVSEVRGVRQQMYRSYPHPRKFLPRSVGKFVIKSV